MKSNPIAILTLVAVAATANLAWGQLIPQVPPVPDVVPDVTNAAQDTVKDATNTAKDATNTAQDAVKDVQDTARDATTTAQDAAKNTAQDAAKNVQDTAKDVQRDATKTTQDAAKDVQDTAKDVQRDATKTTRDATRNAQDATRDATRNARDTARDATDDLRDTTRDTRDATRDTLDATRDTTRGSLETRGSVRTQGSVSGRQGSYRGADLGVWFDSGARNGLIIADIAANAALSGVGFREGDRIISVAGRNVTSEADFVRYLTTGNVRGPLNVVVMRDGQQQTLVVQPDFLNQQMTSEQYEPLEQFGVIVDDRINDRVVVWRVTPRSPAFYAGIRAGDVITAIANRPLPNLAAIAGLTLQQQGMVPIQITRNGRARTIQADFSGLQTGERHMTFRQNLDADIRTNLNTDVNADVNADVDANQSIPMIETAPQSYQNRNYYENRRQYRRSWRRGR